MIRALSSTLHSLSPLRACAAAAAVAVALAGVGCNYAIPALWVIQGPPKKPAEFKLPYDLKTTVFVDDRQNVLSRTQLRAQLADDIAKTLVREKLVADVVSGRELIAYVRKTETPGKRVSIEELGAAVGAQVVIFIEMESFDLASTDNVTPKPIASCKVKVVDISTKKRLFPPTDGNNAGYEVKAETEALQAGIYRTSAGRRQVEDLLEKRLADQISKLFYEHEPRNFGQGVSGLGG